MMNGYDVNLIKLISESISIPLIASGGAGCIEDFEKAFRYGNASAVATGSMVVYQGQNRSVLINFPSRDEIEEILKI